VGGLWVSAAGMEARSSEINVWANDVANVDTPAFQAEQPSLADAVPGNAYPSLVNPAGQPGALAALGAPPEVLQAGGVAPGPVLINTSQAPLQWTGRPLDVAIQGAGWFQVALPGGGVAYTRDGRFSPDAQGVLVDGEGHPLLADTGQPLRVPAGASAVSIAPDGRVLAMVTGRQQVLGRLALAVPADPQGMVPAPDGVWLPTPAAGVLRQVAPGSPGAAPLVPGALAESNVDLTQVLTDILSAQAAYQANSRAFAVALSMWSAANRIPG
jgi:flagellar basal-body rod protein FlgG